MLAENLEIGYHVLKPKHTFIVKVNNNIRKLGYNGPLKVVGSREKGLSISTKFYHAS
jgi:hypothetical protein